MQVSGVRSVGASKADGVVVGMFPDRKAAPGTQPVLEAMGAWALPSLEAQGFEGKSGQVCVLPSGGAEIPSWVAFVGLGDEVDAEGLRQAAGRGMRALPSKVRSVASTLHRIDVEGATAAVLEGIGLADYRYDRFRSTAEPRDDLSVELVGAPKDLAEISERVAVIVETVSLARDFVNEPPIGKGPVALAERMVEAAGKGVKTEIWKGQRLVDERMNGIIAVGAGSHREPCLLTLTYSPRRAKKTLYLVGKGITFDSGGLSLKSSNLMEDMKSDMAGAAAVAAAVMAIARLGIKVNVVGLAALAENMPGGGANRLGDVITYRNDKTVEVLNTDAEGRLVLADALCLAAEAEPDLIVDLATLTGATKVALGGGIAGAYGKDDDEVAAVVSAATAAGERMWAMPLPSDYKTLIESRIADMKNTATGRYGGGIAAALLLAEFVGDNPWVHLDIAGPAFSDSADHYIPKGGTGYGVRTAIEVAASME